MNTDTLHIGDIVFAKPSTAHEYIITTHIRGFIGIVVADGPSPNTMFVLDLFCRSGINTELELQQLIPYNFDFFKHALSNPSQPYTKTVSEDLQGHHNSFLVERKCFSKINDIPFYKWKPLVMTAVEESKENTPYSYKRNSIPTDILERNLDAVIYHFSKHFLTMPSSTLPKLHL